jgi:cold shock protein
MLEFRATVARWNHNRFFGFLTLDGDGREIFCHGSQLRDVGLDALREGQRVEVDVENTPDGSGR